MNKEENRIVPQLRFPEFEKDGYWETETINDLSKTVTAGGTPSTKIEDYWGGDIRWMNSGELNLKIVEEVEGRITKEGLKNSSTKIIPENSVLIGLAGQGKTRGTIAINKVKLCTNQSIASIYPNEDVFDSEFLYHNLDNRYNELRELSAGGEGRGGLNLKIIKEIRIPIPPKKEEQQKIAACLSSLDEVITAETEKLDLLQDHKKGLLQQLFPAEGETQPKFRFPEFKEDGDWEETTLGELAKFRRGSFPQPYGLEEWYDDENGMPFIQVYDVDTNLKIKPKTKRLISELAAQQSVFIEKGTIIITIQGSIGRVAITQYDAYIDRTLLLFQKFYKSTDKLFFAYVIQMLFEIEKQKAPGGIIKTITKEVLTSFVIKLPKIKEQQKIAQCLSAADELIEAQTRKIEALQEHKKGLLQQLFPSINEVTV
ncbi:restriction endonuclease subunit S [Maribacter dokdonensis]|uniref:restriction endonuclease subunit S n=1 Tax=Maribacter dokdonensis TaxID=320912 RepID=UPI002733EE65|nr:restriction endonuclease subunit S [Maribacter dokdonensis]MDP2525647.1 restriction endonuclease subunit S [Maribacter dokdonensis]